MKIFFGGSRKLGRLNHAIKERADNIISNDYTILIGDANGADLAMQKYLAEKSYNNVIIFCAGYNCRNNIGKWKTNFVLVKRTQKDFQYYAVRDEKMSDEADYGFMLWDGKSKGTLNNIINLMQKNKPVLVYFSPKKKFFTLKSENELKEILSFCSKSDLENLNKILKISERICPDQSRLNFG